jgi:small subunit ribosomal protein S8e
MAVWHRGHVGRTSSGGVYRRLRKSRLFERGSEPTLTRIGGGQQVRVVRTKGAGSKAQVVQAAVVNLYDPKSKKYLKAQVKTVAENPANRHYVRRNIITKGAVITTDKGRARVTSRPGQDGTVNAILLE